jgi:hypothetical protein
LADGMNSSPCDVNSRITVKIVSSARKKEHSALSYREV